MDKQNNISVKLLKFLEKVKQNKTYGSVEIYFEAGQVTQITQRVINKISQEKKKVIGNERVNLSQKKSVRHTQSHEFSEIVTDL